MKCLLHKYSNLCFSFHRFSLWHWPEKPRHDVLLHVLEALWPRPLGWIMWLWHVVWTFGAGAAAMWIFTHGYSWPRFNFKSYGKAAYSNVCLSVHISYAYLYLFFVCIYFRKPQFNYWSLSVRLSNGQVYVIFIFCIFVFIRTFENQFQLN